MKKNAYILLIVLIMAPIAQLEAADNVHVYRTAPSAAQLARDLAVKPPAAASSHARKQFRTRSIVFGNAPSAAPPSGKQRTIVFDSAAPAAAASSSQQQQESTSNKPSRVLVFPIYFDSGKAKITAKATPFINSIADLMHMDPSLKFQVEGHTDSKGKRASNIALSLRRAEAVTNYLINERSIDPSRLTPVGKGSKEPLDGVEPHDATNRRVQFRTM